MRGEDMSRICPETKDTVLSQNCVECETKLCRINAHPKDSSVNTDKKRTGPVKTTRKTELRL